MAQEYGTRLTAAGQSLVAQAVAGGQAVNLTTMAVGDGDWGETTPDDLVNQVWSGNINTVEATEGASGAFTTEGIIPASAGGFIIKEVVWRTEDGTAFAISQYPESYKPLPDSGIAGDMVIRAILAVGQADVVNLSIDPSVVLASKKYVDDTLQPLDDRLTAQLEQLESDMGALPISYLVTKPTLTGDTEQSYGNTVNLAVSGAVSAWNNTATSATIDYYEWQLPDESTTQAPTVAWPIANDPALVDDILLFKVRAVDTLGHVSAWVERSVTIVGNRRPEMTSFEHTTPIVAVRNQAVPTTFTGATDPDGDDLLITYRIENAVNVSASKATGIADGESVTLTFDDVPSDTTATFEVIAVDEAGISSDPVTVSVDLRYQAYVVAPEILAPIDGATGVARQPNVATTAFATNPPGFGAQSAMKIYVATDAAMTNIIYEGTFGAVTSAQIAEALPLDTEVHLEVSHVSGELGESARSERISFTVTAAAPGAIMEDGGIVVGQRDGYWLICAPASMRGQNIRHGLYGTDTTLANITSSATPDPQSGYDNTDVLINNYGSVNDGQGSIGPAAALFCRSQGAGYDLPNKEELSDLVAAAATIDANDQTSGITFASMGTGYILSSTECNSYYSWVVRADGGNVDSDNRSNERFVAPVRRIPV